MDNPTRNRAGLKSYFLKNSIPTQSNFAELIDGMINQRDDGLVKLPGNPLSIEAAGDDGSEKKTLNIYASFADQNPAWTLSLNPRSTATDPATAHLGLGISDGDGHTRLFIDRNTGNVGVGTLAPRTKLDIDGPLAISTNANLDPGSFNVLPLEGNGGLLGWNRTGGEGEFDVISLSGFGSDGGFAFIDRPRGGPDLFIMRLKKNGSVGIGVTAPVETLDVNGRVKAGALTIGSWPPSGSYVFVGANTLDQKATGNYALLQGASGSESGVTFLNSPSSIRFRINNVDKMILANNGNVGIGKTDPRSALDTGTGVLSGAANDYQKAQYTMSGGGTVTWGGPGGRLKWTYRFIAISMERASSFAVGFVEIYQPTTTIPAAQVYDGSPRTADSNGVILNNWDALYAVHSVGGDHTAITFQIVNYTKTFYAPSNWLLIAVVNSDNNTIKLGTGQIVAANSSASPGSLMPTGGIIMWSGQPNNIPGGWALCDGGNGTPDLRNRFIVAAGGAYASGNTGGLDSVVLTLDQMPSHNHNNGGYNSLLTVRDDGGFTSSNVDVTRGEPDLLHTGQIQPAGGGRAHENRPPYYALAFIMKL